MTRLQKVFLLVAVMTASCRGTLPSESQVKDDEGETLPEMFTEKVNVFGAEKCAAPGCWTNYLRVTDIDADGDLDVVAVNYGDFFGGGPKKQPLAIYLNDGHANFTDGSSLINSFTAELRQVAIADINGDGRPDIYAPNAIGKVDAFFVSNAQGGFTDEAATRVGGKKSRAGATRFVDVDHDGDLDLFVAAGYASGPIGSNIGDILLNDGTGQFTLLENAITGSVPGNDIDDVDVIDADNDFDPDLLINPHNGAGVTLLVNDGTGHFSVATAAVGPAPGGGNHYDPAICDFNNDNYLDVFVDNIGGGYNELLLMNDKTGSFVDQTATVVGNDNGEDDNGVLCADINNDGSQDAVIISLYPAGERLLLNDGTGKLSYRPGAFRQFQDGTLWGEFGDLNGDNKIDLVTAQGESGGSFQNRVYLANQLVPVDDRVPVIRAFEVVTIAAGTATPVRFAVVDRAVTDEGPRLKAAFARWQIGTEIKEIAATFMGGDLYRVVLPAVTDAANYALCARDTAGNEGCTAMQVVAAH